MEFKRSFSFFIATFYAQTIFHVGFSGYWLLASNFAAIHPCSHFLVQLLAFCLAHVGIVQVVVGKEVFELL